jgi:hypothetical protein
MVGRGEFELSLLSATAERPIWLIPRALTRFSTLEKAFDRSYWRVGARHKHAESHA